MTRPEWARRALEATRSNVVPLLVPTVRDLARGHLVDDAPVLLAGLDAVDPWLVQGSDHRIGDMLSLAIAEQACRLRLREAASRLPAHGFDGPDALVQMAAARRRFETFAEILRVGRNRFAAVLIDQEMAP